MLDQILVLVAKHRIVAVWGLLTVVATVFLLSKSLREASAAAGRAPYADPAQPHQHWSAQTGAGRRVGGWAELQEQHPKKLLAGLWAIWLIIAVTHLFLR